MADSGAPGLSLSLWVVRGQAWGLQLLGGFMWHFCWRLALTVRVGRVKS